MKDLENLIVAFASGLLVKHTPSTQEAESARQQIQPSIQPAPDGTKVIFQNLMRDHLNIKLDTCELGSFIDYSYYLGRIRNARPWHSNTLSLSISPYLQGILVQLPTLPEGDEYIFPPQTSASIKVAGFVGEDMLIEMKNCSPWIANALATL